LLHRLVRLLLLRAQVLVEKTPRLLRPEASRFRSLARHAVGEQVGDADARFRHPDDALRQRDRGVRDDAPREARRLAVVGIAEGVIRRQPEIRVCERVFLVGHYLVPSTLAAAPAPYISSKCLASFGSFFSACTWFASGAFAACGALMTSPVSVFTATLSLVGLPRLSAGPSES